MEERKGEDLGIREPLEGGVAPPSRVEARVGVVDFAEQDGHGLFKEGEPCGMLGVGHLILLWAGSQMAFFLSHQPRNTHLVLRQR